MNKRILTLLLCLFGCIGSLTTFALTDAQAASLAQRYTPPAIEQARQKLGGDPFLDEVLANPLQQLQFSDGHLRYLAFTMPGDQNQYVLLGWQDTVGAVYWRLLKSPDGGETYMVCQDAPYWCGAFDSFFFRVEDLTGDGIPEILIEDAAHESLFVFAWKKGQMVSITPLNQEVSSLNTSIKEGDTVFGSSQGVELEDVDGDGVAEVVVNADFTNEPDANGDYTLKPVSPTEIYKYDGTTYVLWKKIPYSDKEPFPINVPSLGVIHPGTIPLAELEAQANAKKVSGKGSADLEVFVSHPAAGDTVDDLVQDSFKYKSIPLTFVKRWPNKKRPDTSYANQDLMGCAVDEVTAKGAGEWNPSPEDPWMPSPDGAMENHFVGAYLELQLPRSAVFPDLLQESNAYFAKNPGKTVYFAYVPISGKTKSGKISVVNALVCVKNTATNSAAASKAQDSDSKGATPKK